MKNTTALLYPAEYYHIYNRGNNRDDIFIEERNYSYFLSLYSKYIDPIADTYAYCLMRNHFHLLVRIKAEEEILRGLRSNLTPRKNLTPQKNLTGFGNL